MNRTNYKIQTKINRPVGEVFDAIVSEKQLVAYFVDTTSGPLTVGDTVTWHWRDFGDHPVVVRHIAVNERIELELNSTDWRKTEGDGYSVKVIFQLDTLDDDHTLLSISEQGWLSDEPGLKASHENCGGWQHMSMCLKVYLEYGIDAR